MHLTLETKSQPDATARIGPLMLTPTVSEEYWTWRVRLSDTQSIIGFPKFNTIGIGFAREDDDWNTNLPYICAAEEIYAHIECNKGDYSISREDCIKAIEMIQEAACADRNDN